MLDLLKSKLKKAKSDEEEENTSAESSSDIDDMEDMLDETGTFMIDLDKLKEHEDLKDLLDDV